MSLDTPTPPTSVYIPIHIFTPFKSMGETGEERSEMGELSNPLHIFRELLTARYSNLSGKNVFN